VTLVQQPAAALPALLLQRDTDLNLPPTPPEPAPSLYSHFGPPPAAGGGGGGGGFALAGLPDIFSTARAEFTSSALAGMAGDAPVHFIAPSEHMKQLFTLPFTPGRVAFPVHRVGNALVLDGGRSLGVGLAPGPASAQMRSEQALVDALGRIGLLSSSQPGAGVPDPAEAALALPPPPSFSLTTAARHPGTFAVHTGNSVHTKTSDVHTGPPGPASTQLAPVADPTAGVAAEPLSLYSRFLHHSVSEAEAADGAAGGGGVSPGAAGSHEPNKVILSNPELG